MCSSDLLASAIISIILAIITIVYSFYTNSRSNGQIEILNQSARDVQNASQSYKESADSLEANIAKIINAINRVEAKTDRILIHSLSEGSNTTNEINPQPLTFPSSRFLVKKRMRRRWRLPNRLHRWYQQSEVISAGS